MHFTKFLKYVSKDSQSTKFPVSTLTLVYSKTMSGWKSLEITCEICSKIRVHVYFTLILQILVQFHPNSTLIYKNSMQFFRTGLEFEILGEAFRNVTKLNYYNMKKKRNKNFFLPKSL